MASDAATPGEDGLPDEVVAFGGESTIFHRPTGDEGEEPRAACRTPSRTTFRKERRVVDLHYRPCKICFPFARGGRP
jgi:hypothetical protein